MKGSGVAGTILCPLLLSILTEGCNQNASTRMNYNIGDHQLILHQNFLPDDEASALLLRLQKEIPWHQGRIRLFGRERTIPRKQCWVAEAGLSYRYSGSTLEPTPWPEWLRPLAAKVSRAAGCNFNSVLCNLYRDGQDSMGWHSDDEPELGTDPIIASLSLGAERRFRFRHRQDHKHTRCLLLPNNSLLIMPAGLQAQWQHELPKTRQLTGPRVNLTFRHVVHG